MATTWEFIAAEWLGTDDGCAPASYYLDAYLDDAWRSLGLSGDCPEAVDDEALARRVAGAVREDNYGVMPRIVVRERATD